MHHFNAADNHPEAASRWVSWIPMAGRMRSRHLSESLGSFGNPLPWVRNQQHNKNTVGPSAAFAMARGQFVSSKENDVGFFLLSYGYEQGYLQPHGLPA
ncbi:hypothetical protein CPAR01_14078 [Colletotrichum paranaense]|uniref:Uncharacterized protein n=1 Tax=Colletotrichum paranaense TaxID=1914294 RepID=A0ABQ9S342_9PEZI|nr:uncharacterized protein CPAR01_14078 [Colletotrichum paranaense]KAK1523225.1 hypothetical protein CPAR01_14078 [Colletotrichum paranaense]